MTLTFDYERLAERYKRSPAEIKSKVESYAADIKRELADFYKPDVIDGEVEKIVANNLSSLFQLKGIDYAKEQHEKGNIKKANVIVLGVSPSEDRNSYEKWLAREAYKSDPNGAIAAKKVRVQKRDDGSSYPVALDSKATITRKNSDGTVTEEPNPNYGKDIPNAYKVNVPMIVAAYVNVKDGKESSEPCEDFVMGSMNWDKELENQPYVGKKSTVYGRLNGQYFSISKDAYEGKDAYEKAYDVAARVLPNTEYWMDLAAIAEQPIVDVVNGKRKNIYTKFATKGTVQKVDVREMKSQWNNSKYYKGYVRIGDVDVVDGINLSTTYAPLVADLDDGNNNPNQVTENDEVIVFGCKKSFAKKDDNGNFIKDADGNNEMIPYYELWGVIKAYDDEKDKVLQRLREKGLL